MHRLLPTLLLLTLLQLVTPAFAQPPASPSFEVASVKPVEGPRGRLYDFSSSGARVRYIAYSLPELIMEAWNLKNYQVALAPPVAQLFARDDIQRFDIEAQAEGVTARTRDQFRPLLQTLLADRFKLRFHRQPKEMPVYALTVNKGGPKLKPAAADADPSAYIANSGQNAVITASQIDTEALAQLIASVFSLDRPVVDNTDLAGAWALRLEATPQPRILRDDPDSTHLTIFAALQQQLGLRLDLRNAPVEVLIVDRAEKPAAN